MQYTVISANSWGLLCLILQVSVLTMVRYSEHLLCFAICDIYIYMKNFGDGEGMNDSVCMCVYIYIYISCFLFII